MRRTARAEAQERMEARRRRDEMSPRLQEEVPTLLTLRLEFEDFRRGGTSSQTRYTKHIIVARAAALFVVPCPDRECDGEHDISSEVMRELRSSVPEFKGEQVCRGYRRTDRCEHRLTFRVLATYQGA
jgi:hypothetical protein